MAGKRATAPDFQQAPFLAALPDAADLAAAWSAFIPLSPKEFYDSICNGPLVKSHLHIRLSQSGELEMILEKPTPDGPPALVMGTTWKLGMGRGDLKSVRVAPHLQGQGLARAAVRNTFAVARKLGVSRIGTVASLENGGYTWARFGFKPYPVYWKNLRTGHLRPRLERFAACMPENARAQLEAAISSDNPEAIFLIAALKTPTHDVPAGRWLLASANWLRQERAPDLYQWDKLRKSAQDRLEKVKGQLSPEAFQEIGLLLESPQPKTALELRDIPHTISGIPLGQLMLTGTEWDGELDFGNPAQAALYHAYVGQDMTPAPAAKPPTPTRKPGGPHG